VSPSSEVLVFYNADGQTRPDFLRSLVVPLLEGDAQVTTSCRWMNPVHGTLPEYFNMLYGDILLSLQMHPRHTLPWGGAMALRRDLFEQIDVPGLWRGALCDDNALGQLLRSKGISTTFVPRAMVVEPAYSTWRSFFAYGIRQLFFLRVTILVDWLLGAATLTVLGPALLSLLGWLGVAAIIGRWTLDKSVMAVVVAMLFGLLYETIRNFETGMEELLTGIGFKLTPAPIWALLLSPLALMVMWIQIIASGFGRRVKWGPIVYEALGLSKTRVVSVEN
jgi:hypothetical protein